MPNQKPETPPQNLKHKHARSSQIATNEEQIRQVLEDFENAFETKDLKALMSLYSENVITYDETEELVYEGRDVYRKVWQQCFETSQKLELKVREMKIFVDQTVAFVHYLCHVRGNNKDGQSVEHWSRCTVGFVKENEKWLINHEHISVPYDPNIGYVLWDAEPSPILTQ